MPDTPEHPFVTRLKQIIERVIDDDRFPPSTWVPARRSVAQLAQLSDAGLSNWLRGGDGIPASGKDNSHLSALDRAAGELWADYPWPDGTGPTLADLAAGNPQSAPGTDHEPGDESATAAVEADAARVSEPPPGSPTPRLPRLPRRTQVVVMAGVSLGIVGLAILIALVIGRGSSSPQPTGKDASPTASATDLVGATASAQLPSGATAELTFDALGGTGSKVIDVYAGPGDTAADHVKTGTYQDGQEVPVKCRAAGRAVRSDPTMGEEERRSLEWVELIGTTGTTQFATLVYGNLDRPSSSVPKCPL